VDTDAPPPSLPPESLSSGQLPPDSIPPSGMGGRSRTTYVPPPPRIKTALEEQRDRLLGFVEQLGEIATLTGNTAKALFKRPLEIASTIYQMESLGVRSMGIVAVSSLFIGMVMTIQFAFGLRRFGGLEYIPRVVVLSFARELAPTLTAVIVGGRIGSGMAAEVGAMNVTEQVDAIRALGADPVKKLVVPRVVAAILVMPILGIFAFTLGTVGAIFICRFEFGISQQFFIESALETLQMADFLSGLAKTPVFGLIIAIVGCHFGLRTSGGTEGVGLSTTRTVVVVSIAILVADFMMTKLFIMLVPT
jgi:phospholipid/cholesterol/gamma-HCH transport system permease protein